MSIKQVYAIQSERALNATMDYRDIWHDILNNKMLHNLHISRKQRLVCWSKEKIKKILQIKCQADDSIEQSCYF